MAAAGLYAAVLIALALLALLFLRRRRKRAAPLPRVEEADSGDDESGIEVGVDAGLEGADARAARLERELARASEARRREQAEFFEKSDARLRETFAALSREALQRNSEAFLSLAGSHLGELRRESEPGPGSPNSAVDSLLGPMGDALSRMGTALEAAERTRAEDHAGFAAAQRGLLEATDRLTRTLRQSGARGGWGGLQLRRVVEMAGMLEYCDFGRPASGADGLRPDLVVRMAGGRSIVVDAKVPMDDFVKAQEAGSEGEEREFRRAHAKAVRVHMAGLASKSYWSRFEEKPDFVIMYFPNEAVFIEALRIDPDLVEYGVLRQVIPASPATFIALLRTAACGWRQERMLENARHIFDLGTRLHECFAAEYGHLSGLGAALTEAVERFNHCVASADRQLFPALRRLGRLTEREAFPSPEEIDIRPGMSAGAPAPAAAGDGALDAEDCDAMDVGGGDADVDASGQTAPNPLDEGEPPVPEAAAEPATEADLKDGGEAGSEPTDNFDEPGAACEFVGPADELEVEVAVQEEELPIPLVASEVAEAK